jgi:hydrogenase nickel incorporation protein HypB
MMKEFRVIELKKGIYERNDAVANSIREKLKEDKTFFLNLMSSPGAGKTTLLVNTIETLKEEMRIAVMEADIDSDVDTKAVLKTGVKAIQLHTGGMCHLDASMTRQGIDGLGADGADFIILENIGNLICTAGYDTGATKNAVVLSVPEGDDKPLKYPRMFEIADVMIITKMDTLPVFDFEVDVCIERAKKLNPNIEVFPLSAKTGEGMEAWVGWLRQKVASTKV